MRLGIHLRSTWPYVELTQTAQARKQYEKTVQQRPDVERLAWELIHRGRENHFAEQLERAFRETK